MPAKLIAAAAFVGALLAGADTHDLSRLMAPARADTLELARKLVHYTGGVSLILHNFEPALAAKTQAPEIFAESYDVAMKDDEAAIAAADDSVAHVYAGVYPPQQLAAEVGFYESAEGQSIMAKNRGPFGSVIWPDPGSLRLSAAESAALRKYNATVQARAQVAAQNPKAMDQILAAETKALIKVRSDAFANYCRSRDCKVEGVKFP
jgi:hypothetical protein